MATSLLTKSSRSSRFFFTLFILGACQIVVAQVPNAFNYQALAKDNAGKVIANKNITLRASIVSNSATGSAEYSEIHATTTDDQGIFMLELGAGTPVTGTFQQINWAVGTKWLKIEMDALGGTNYSLVGASQLLSVPYALYAASAGSSDPGSKQDGAITDIATSTYFDNKSITAASISSENASISILKTAIDKDTNTYILASFSNGNITIGSTLLDGSIYNQFLAKILPNGTVAWVNGIKLYNPNDYSLDPKISLVGNIIVVGFTSIGNLRFGSQVFPPNSNGDYDHFILGVNTQSGDISWNQRLNVVGKYNIGLLGNEGSNLYISGGYNKSAFQVGNQTFTSSTGSYLTQINVQTGVFNWSLPLGANASVSASTIVDNNLYFAGIFSGQTQIGTYTLGTSSSSNTYFFVMNVSKIGSVISSPVYTLGETLYSSTFSDILYFQKSIFLSKSAGQSAGISRYDLNTGQFITTSFYSTNISNLFSDTVNNYLYSNRLTKHNIDGSLSNSGGISNLTRPFTGLKDGTCYFLSNGNLRLGNTIYNAPATATFMLKYDMNTETVKDAYLIKHIDCVFTAPLILGNRKILIANKGLIKVNGTILKGLVYIKF